MAKAAKSRKLTGKALGTAGAAPVIAGPVQDMPEFSDALALISTLSGERQGVEWDIKVYLTTGTGGRGNTAKPQFLFSVELDDLRHLEERLAETYAPQGGGDFRVMVRADNELVKNIPLSIAPLPGWKPPRPSYLPAIVTPENPQTDRSGMDRIADLILAGQEQTRQLIAALANRPEQKQPTLLEQIQLMSEIQKLAPQGQQQAGMDMFNKAFELAKTMYEGQSSGGGKSWLDVVETALNSPIIKDMLSGAVAAAASAHNQPPQLAQPPRLVTQQNQIAVQMIETLLKQAVVPVDPKVVADQINDHAPHALMDELGAQDDIAGYIIQNFPQAAPHRAWLEQVIANIWTPDDGVPSPTFNQPPPNAQAPAAQKAN